MCLFVIFSLMTGAIIELDKLIFHTWEFNCGENWKRICGEKKRSEKHKWKYGARSLRDCRSRIISGCWDACRGVFGMPSRGKTNFPCPRSWMMREKFPERRMDGQTPTPGREPPRSRKGTRSFRIYLYNTYEACIQSTQTSCRRGLANPFPSSSPKASKERSFESPFVNMGFGRKEDDAAASLRLWLKI